MISKKITNQQVHNILFIHGAWHSSWYWNVFFMDYFYKKGYSVHALDLSNHGNNLKNKHINLTTFSDYVKDIEDAVKKIGQPVILVGHSMGGGVIQKYLEHHPAQAAILLATFPHSGAFRTSWNVLKKFPHRFFKGILTFNIYEVVKGEKQAKWAFYDDTITKSQLSKYSALITKESFLVFIQMLLFQVAIKYHRQIPMLVIGAKKDTIFTLQEQAQTAKKYNADYYEVDTTHNLMLTAAWKDVADKILHWLNTKGISSPHALAS